MLRMQSRLTARDWTLLRWLADHGTLTTFQINTGLFGSLDFAQRRLRKLTDAGVLDRFRPQRADGGSYPYHYVLTQLGVELVAAQRGEASPRRDAATKRRRHLTSRANLPHLLGVNGFFTALAGYARTHPGARLARWWPASRCRGIGAFARDDDATDDRGRRYVPGLFYQPRVRPDGHGIWIENDTRVPFFLEHDTGSEPLWRLLDKIDAYAELAAGIEQAWPALFWLHSAARERHLHRKLAAERNTHPVATATRDHAAHDGKSPAQDVWWLHGHQGPLLRLADLAACVVDVPYRLPGEQRRRHAD